MLTHKSMLLQEGERSLLEQSGHGGYVPPSVWALKTRATMWAMWCGIFIIQKPTCSRVPQKNFMLVQVQFGNLDRRSKRKDCAWNSLNVLYECRLESREKSRRWEVETNFKIHQSCLREQKSLQVEKVLEHVFFLMLANLIVNFPLRLYMLAKKSTCDKIMHY